MAGHSKFKNIMHRKGAQDNKRAKLFTKLVREIFIATKLGNPDPEHNTRLRAAIAAARVCNVPKDRIEGAIKKASTTGHGENYDEIRYEGYASGGIAIIVEALTDNRNRTASEVRSAFTKSGGTLGETGSVNFLFDRVGLIEYSVNITSHEEILEHAIEAGADDCYISEDMHTIICKPDELHEVRDFLTSKYDYPEVARLTWKEKEPILITDLDTAEKLIKLVETLEDNDDIQHVCGNYLIDDTIIEAIK